MPSFPATRLIYATALLSIFYGPTLGASAAPEPPQVAPTTISLSAIPSPSEFGKNVAITAIVNPSSATGLVTFYDGVTVLGTGILSGGQAVLDTSLLASGARSLHAHYNGDSTHGPSNSAATPQSVTAVSAVTFLPAVSYAATEPLTVAIGDFNGDGNADLALPSPSGAAGTLRILLGNGDGTFRIGGDYGSVPLPSAIAVGDFNGDGKTDLAVGGTTGDTVSVFLGNGNGTFQAPTTVNVPVDFYKIVVADFNGDGKPDLAALAFQGAGIWVLLGNGDGTFQTAVNYAGADTTHSLAVADFNRDGKPDIVTTSAADGSVVVLLGNGDGTFATGVEYPAGGGTGGYLASLTTGDFNGDGKPDIAVATAGSVVVLLGNGDGTFQSAVSYQGSQNPSGVVAADFNGDGFPDLGVTDSSAGTVSLFIGRGDGTFAEPPVVYSNVGVEPYSLAAGEFNGDGRTDLAVANFGNGGNGSSTVGVLLASSAAGISCSPSSFNLTSFVGANPISTGCLVTTVPSGAAVTASPSTTNGGAWLSVPASTTGGSSLPITITPGSLTAGTYTGSINLQGSGAGATVPVTLTIYNLPSLSITVTPVGNFTQGQTQAQYSLTVSNQAAGSQTSGVVTVTETVPSGLTLVSMSGLGWTCSGNACTRSDVLAGGSSYTAILMTLDVTGTLPQTNTVTASGGSSATATFVFSTEVLTPATVSLTSLTNPSVFGQTATLTATVTPNTATGRVTFYEGTTILGISTLSSGAAPLSTIMLPTGTITPATLTSAVRAYYGGDTAHGPNTSNLVAQSVTSRPGGALVAGQSYPGPNLISEVVADFNGDGKPDLAVVGFVEGGSGSIDVLLGDGQGNLNSLASFGDGNGPASLAVGDFNGDGKVDLAVLNSNASISVLLGNGDGTFQPPVTNTLGGNPLRIVVADFNGDGKADLALAYGNGSVSVLLGNGDGTFQSQIAHAASTNLTLVVGDFNGDGKPDLAFATSNGIAVMLGNGDGTLQAPIPLVTNLNTLALVVADFNADGKQDLALANNSGTVQILLGNGNGTFQTGGSYTVGASPDCLAASDFNGDGKTDLAVCSLTGVSLLPGNGDGTFQAQTTYTTSTNALAMVVADFNEDGRPDVAVAGQGNSVPLSILLGSGAGPVLNISSTHTGNFTLGEAGAAYSVIVSNGGGAATSGAVTVIDTLPTGLTATAIAGNNWTCTLVTLTCTRSDALNPGSSYSPITVTVTVAGNAAVSVTNQVSVSGGGSPSAGGNDATLIFSLCDLKQTGSVTVADVQLIINEALGVSPVVYDLSGNGVVNVVDVQIEINAALGLGCAAR